MNGFHIDMNMALYKADYLKAWLTELAAMGYNTIVWELEDSVVWETAPEASQPDALSKEAFREVLKHARGLGLEHIPLLQTLGHVEYLLQYDKYKHLRANPDNTTQYNPFHPEVVPLIHTWIAEYLDLFGQVKYFHIGADEARELDFIQQSEWNKEGLNVSQIFMRHINAVSEPLLERGVTPIIWADMVLHHHEAIDELSRDIMLFDWMYDIWRGNGKVFIWGDDRGLRTRDQLNAETMGLFGKHMFPNGDAPGVDPETFYSADFLADKGFATVTCPGSSSFGDNVFAPRHELHLWNAWDSAEKGMQTPGLSGSVLTSWSMHLHPWELQHAQIAAFGYQSRNPGKSLNDFRAWYVKDAYGLQDDRFWKAADGLAGLCQFSSSRTLGYDKACLPVSKDHIENAIVKMIEADRLDIEIMRAQKCAQDYTQSLELFRTLRQDATKGHAILDLWELAARNLINRAQAVEVILQSRTDSYAPEADRDRVNAILKDMQALHAEYEDVYAGMIRPNRRALMIGYMFDAVETELMRLAGE